jgi:hypothetical protein
MRSTSTLPMLLAGVTLSFTSYSQNTAIGTDGSSSYVSMTANVVPGSGDFTVEFWAYMSSLGASLREFISQGSSTAGQNFYIGTDGTLMTIRCGDPWQNSGIAMPVNQWTHVALVRSGTNASLYLNGILKASTTGYTISTGGTGLRIGRQYGALAEYMNASVDELRVWNTTRTASQIKSGMFGIIATNTPGLAAYYKMNEGSGTTLGNSTSTTGLGGTLVNSPAWVSSPCSIVPMRLHSTGWTTRSVCPPTLCTIFPQGPLNAG